MSINYWAVLVSAIASMVVGSIWYGPLFGKKYMSAMGMDMWSEEKRAEMKKSMTMTYAWQFVASLVMFSILAWFIQALTTYTLATTSYLAGEMPNVGLWTGLEVAFWMWLGFIVPVKLGDALWGGKMSLFGLSIGNMLVTLLVGGAIIGAWL